MKTLLHIPTQQYGFISLESEGEEIITNEAIKAAHEAYNSATVILKGGVGVSDKEMNTFVDNQLLGAEGNTIEIYERMNELQKYAIQTNKRALARIKRREDSIE